MDRSGQDDDGVHDWSWWPGKESGVGINKRESSAVARSVDRRLACGVRRRRECARGNRRRDYLGRRSVACAGGVEVEQIDRQRYECAKVISTQPLLRRTYENDTQYIISFDLNVTRIYAIYINTWEEVLVLRETPPWQSIARAISRHARNQFPFCLVVFNYVHM
jgi:hypothetical protein